jgi:hypothetical protein
MHTNQVNQSCTPVVAALERTTGSGDNNNMVSAWMHDYNNHHEVFYTDHGLPMFRPTLYTIMILPGALIQTTQINDENNNSLAGVAFTSVVARRGNQYRREILNQAIVDALYITSNLEQQRFE